MVAVNTYGKEQTAWAEDAPAWNITGRARVGRAHLYPRGEASRAAKIEGSRMFAVNKGLSLETERIEQGVRNGLAAIDPREAYAYLPDWEEALALPDEANASKDPNDRRLAAYEKLTSPGGQSPDFFIEVAAALGYEIEVEHNLYDDAPYCGTFPTSSAMTGRSRCATSTIGHFVTIHVKGSGNDAQLEAAIRRYFHLHAVLTFAYDL